MYAVRKEYADGGLQNGKVIVCRIKSYHNVKGKIYPILKEVGEKRIVDATLHNLYVELDNAVEAISTKKQKS